MYFRLSTVNNVSYVTAVKSERVGGKPRQTIVCNFGRLDKLLVNNSLVNMALRLETLTDNMLILTELRKEVIEKQRAKIIGPVIIFEKIWSKYHIGETIKELSRNRKFEFDIERVIFACTLQRILNPGSDNSLVDWLNGYEIQGCENIQVQHCYRAMRWLGEPLDGQEPELDPEPEVEPEHSEADEDSESAVKKGKVKGKEKPTPKQAKSVRCMKDVIEEVLFAKRTNLLTLTEFVFFDTTSLYFEGEGGDLGMRGHSKDHRPDLKQTVFGSVLDNDGKPICTEIWPGNTADVTTLLPIAYRLKNRFHIEHVCLVADRGMISQNTIDSLKQIGWSYIFGVKMRAEKEIKDLFDDDSPFIEVVGPRVKRSDPAPLQIKEAIRNNNRYIVCLNTEEEERDRLTRQAIIDKLEESLKRSNKELIGNKGYKKFVTNLKDAFQIDTDKVKADEKYDGLYVLKTNLDLDARVIALQYKRQIAIERLFRTFKSEFNTRPIFHQNSPNIRGHIWISFLAFLVQKLLMEQINKIRKEDEPMVSWDKLKNDLNKLDTCIMESGSKRFQLRSVAEPLTVLAFKALGIRLPNNLVQLPDKI